MSHRVSWIESRPKGAPRYPVYRYAVIYEDRVPGYHRTLKEAMEEAEREMEGIRRWDRVDAEGTDRVYYRPIISAGTDRPLQPSGSEHGG
jgi:hypothetical protein